MKLRKEVNLLKVNKMDFVTGFMFSTNKSRVALIREIKLGWLHECLDGKACLAGITGMIEENELPLQAMKRKFAEKAGLFHHDWRLFCELEGVWGREYFFTAKGEVDLLTSIVDEIIEIIEVDKIYQRKTMLNLRWLIPLAAENGEIALIEREVIEVCR